jgi:ABC-type thiamine transport system substrate-binding protein
MQHPNPTKLGAPVAVASNSPQSGSQGLPVVWWVKARRGEEATIRWWGQFFRCELEWVEMGLGAYLITNISLASVAR